MIKRRKSLKRKDQPGRIDPESELPYKTGINPQLFQNLCKVHCTLYEILSILNINQMQLEKWCKDYYGVSYDEAYQKYSCEGKASLRRSQFRLAEKNATMSIWLGKQYLDQKDNQNITHTHINDEDQIVQKYNKEEESTD